MKVYLEFYGYEPGKKDHSMSLILKSPVKVELTEKMVDTAEFIKSGLYLLLFHSDLIIECDFLSETRQVIKTVGDIYAELINPDFEDTYCVEKDISFRSKKLIGVSKGESQCAI